MELKYEWDKINEFNVEKPLCEIYTIFFKRIKTHTRNKKYQVWDKLNIENQTRRNFITNLDFDYKIHFYSLIFSSQPSQSV